MALTDDLRAEALSAGFVKMGVCRPDAVPDLPDRLGTFLSQGRHGQMGWMAERTVWRADPAALWPAARSVVIFAESYAPKHDPLEVLDRPEAGAISVYAQGRDYHDVVKKRLKRVARWLVARLEADAADGDAAARAALEAGDDRGGAPSPVKIFVDTAPVMEKPLAQAAGLGWQGKHTNLLGRDFGNWVFLGALFTTAELVPDAPETEHCGTCTACLDICPTDAFPAPFQLDARRCISYLTIEHDGPVPEEFRAALGNRIYGCDDCLAVCPWNKFATRARDARLVAGPEAPDLADLAALDDASFRARFAGTAIKRIGRGRFVRNVAYAIGNSGAARLRPAAEALRGDPDPAVAEAAHWAVSRLSGT